VNGSSGSEEVRRRVRLDALNRCGYCLAPQALVLGWLEIDHIVPEAAGGPDTEDNLWLACRLCNGYKSDQTDGLDPVSGQRVALFNPRRQRWSEHFAWSADGTHVRGLTPCGRATVIAVQLNNPLALSVRRAWVAVGWHPPAF
jgi:hypothetical protein